MKIAHEKAAFAGLTITLESAAECAALGALIGSASVSDVRNKFALMPAGYYADRDVTVDQVGGAFATINYPVYVACIKAACGNRGGAST